MTLDHYNGLFNPVALNTMTFFLCLMPERAVGFSVRAAHADEYSQIK